MSYPGYPMYAAPGPSGLAAAISTSTTTSRIKPKGPVIPYQSYPGAVQQSHLAGSVNVAAGIAAGTTQADQGNTSKSADGNPKKKGKKFVRLAGGQVWEDPSLQEWDPNDFRIFCGDLGNDVNDDVLAKAFSKYPSFLKAKVVRDKRTNKSRGFGFVSFKDPQDFTRAMREMNGKYVGSRPIKLRKSTWKERDAKVVQKKQKEKVKLGLL